MLKNIRSIYLTKLKTKVILCLVNRTKGGESMKYRIKEFREELGMTQEELSIKSGVSRTIISGLEKNTVKTTTVKTLMSIAKALNKDIGDIFLQI